MVVEIQRTYDIYICMRGYKGVESVESRKTELMQSLYSNEKRSSGKVLIEKTYSNDDITKGVNKRTHMLTRKKKGKGREGKQAEIVQLRTVIQGMTRHMISTGTEVRSLPGGMQNVQDNGRLKCLRHLPPTTGVRIGMHRIRIRIHKIPDSNSSQIWAYSGDVVGAFAMLKGSKTKLQKMMMVEMHETGRN